MLLDLKPSDRLTLSFLALLSCSTVLSSAVNPSLTRLLATYSLLAFATVAAALYRTKAGSTQRGFHLSVVITVIAILSIFNSLGALITSIHSTTCDAVLITVDHAIFGVHPTVWMERLISPILSDLLQFAYISYYFIPLSLGILLIKRGRYREFEEVLFGILLCFYLSYIGYLLFPAIGPRFTLSHLQTVNLQLSPFMATIHDTLNSLENNKADAFPSGHTAISLMSLYYALIMGEKRLFTALIPVVTALLISTVYLRYHYVIDVIAGAGLTIMSIVLAPGMRRFLAGAVSRRSS